jgi:hypothetical protein
LTTVAVKVVVASFYTIVVVLQYVDSCYAMIVSMCSMDEIKILKRILLMKVVSNEDYAKRCMVTCINA